MKNLKYVAALVIAAVIFAATPNTPAQTRQTDQEKRIASVRSKIQKRSLERDTVKVKLNSGTTYVGTVREARDRDFDIVDKTGNSQLVNYGDVKSVDGKGLSSGAKLGIGIGIGVGAVLAVLGLIIASDN